MSNMPTFENPCGAYSRYEITKSIPLDRLQEICQAQQDGRLVVLPCKVGTKLYKAVINRGEPAASYVLDYPFGWHTYDATVEGLKDNTVFLTHTEAEAALKEAQK